MNRQEYMEVLKEKLSGVDADLREEIMSDYEEHFNMGAAGGKSEEQIIGELGNIDELVSEIAELSNEAKPEKKEAKNTGENTNTAKEDNANNCNTDKDNKWKNPFEGFDPGKVFSNFQPKNFEEYVSGFAKGLGTVGAAIFKGAESFAGSAQNFAQDVSNSFSRTVNDINLKGKNVKAENTDDSVKDADFEKVSDDEEEDIDELFEQVAEKAVGATTMSDTRADKVVISANCADVTVTESTDDQIRFNYENRGTAAQKLAYKFYHKQDGSTIYVEIKKVGDLNDFFRNVSSPEIQLSVEIPRTLKSFMVRSMSGDIDCQSIACDKLVAESMSGDVDVSGEFGSVRVKTVSGDIDIDGTVSRYTSARTVSGDVEFNGRGSEKMNVSTVSGDVNVNLDDCEGYSAKITTVSGDADLEFGDCKKSDVRNGNYFLGNGKLDINATTVSGDISIEG